MLAILHAAYYKLYSASNLHGNKHQIGNLASEIVYYKEGERSVDCRAEGAESIRGWRKCASLKGTWTSCICLRARGGKVLHTRYCKYNKHIRDTKPDGKVSCVSLKSLSGTPQYESIFYPPTRRSLKVCDVMGSTTNGNVYAFSFPILLLLHSRTQANYPRGNQQIYAGDTLMRCEWGFILRTWSTDGESPSPLPPPSTHYWASVRLGNWISLLTRSVGRAFSNLHLPLLIRWGALSRESAIGIAMTTPSNAGASSSVAA